MRLIFMPEGIKLRGDTESTTVCETHVKLSCADSTLKTVGRSEDEEQSITYEAAVFC